MREPQVGNLCGVCSDGAPSMLGEKSGCQTLVRNLSPKVITVYCMAGTTKLFLRKPQNLSTMLLKKLSKQ